jgi:hypothetical protein
MASASQERVQAAQRITNTFSVLEVARALEKVKSQVIGTIGLRRAMARAKHAARVDNPRATLATSGRVIKAAMVAGSWFWGCRLHFFPQVKLRSGYPHPGLFWRKSSESIENKELRARKVVKSLELVEIAGLGDSRWKISDSDQRLEIWGSSWQAAEDGDLRQAARRCCAATTMAYFTA